MKINLISTIRNYRRLISYKLELLYSHVKILKVRILHKICSYLVPDNFTILSEDCIGGAIYQYFGKKYTSPTVGLWISQPNYIHFINNIQDIASYNLEFEKTNKLNYPVGLIDGVRIGFKHYKTELEAKKKWRERCKRINYNNLFVKIDFRYPWYTKKDIDSWNAMELKKSIAIINKDITKKYGEIHNSICLKSKQDYNNTRKELMKKLVFWEWLNKGVVKKPTFLEQMFLKFLASLYY